MPRLISLAVACLIAAPATAEPAKCFDRAVLVAFLQTEYGETQAAMDFQEGIGLVEVFANRRTGTWTMLSVMPHGMSCLISSGDATPGTAPAEAPA